MANELVNRVRFSTTISKETAEKLKEFANETMIPVSKIVDKAVADYISNYKKGVDTSTNP